MYIRRGFGSELHNVSIMVSERVLPPPKAKVSQAEKEALAQEIEEVLQEGEELLADFSSVSSGSSVDSTELDLLVQIIQETIENPEEEEEEMPVQ